MISARKYILTALIIYTSFANASKVPVPAYELDLSNWEQEESFHCYVKRAVFFQEHVHTQMRRDGSKRILIRFMVNGELIALEDIVINERPSRVTYLQSTSGWQRSRRVRLLFEEDFITSRRYALEYTGATLDELERANCAK